MSAEDQAPPSSGVERAVVATFERSLTRCLANGDFVQAFYDRFLGTSDEVRRRFSKTDFTRQKRVLEQSLYLMARAALGLDDGLEHLHATAEAHSRGRLDIGPSLYAHWLDSLVMTARTHDPEFDWRIEHAWRTLLSSCIDRMVDVYRRSQTAPPPSDPDR